MAIFLNSIITIDIAMKRSLINLYINFYSFNKNLRKKIYSLTGNKIKNKFVQLIRSDNLFKKLINI